VYLAQKSIDFQTVEDVEYMRADIRPFEIPEKFLGNVIGKIRCPTCNRDFQTTIPLKDFITSSGPRLGTFTHYEDDMGCGSVFVVIETRHTKIKVQVSDKEGKQKETWLDLVI
jgi:hypothetical protein